MEWQPGDVSGDIEDRRSAGDGGGGMDFGAPHLGVGGSLILLILSVIVHRNFFAFFSGGGVPTTTAPAARSNPFLGRSRIGQFVSFRLVRAGRCAAHMVNVASSASESAVVATRSQCCSATPRNPPAERRKPR